MNSSGGRTRDFERLVPMYVWFASFLAVFALLLISRLSVVQRPPVFQQIFWLVGGAVMGAIVVVIVSQCRARFWGYRILDPLPRDLRTLKWVSFGIVVAVIVTLFDALVDRSKIANILKDHGSLFDWCMGSLTIVGIWLTYNTIVETQRIIRSFNQLYDRMIKLVEDTSALGADAQLHFLAYTASIGYLALPESRWYELAGKMKSLGKNLKMICLDDDDLSCWHNHYIGRSTSRQPADRAHSLTLEDTFSATDESEQAARSAECRKRRSEIMPGYYLIFNARRAIIVAPFFIPPHPLTLLSMENPKTQGVQMFGFETTDSRIIEDVTRLFNYYWDSPANQLCYFDTQSGSPETISDAMAKKLEQWTAGAALKGKCLRYRVFVAEEDPWAKILSYLSTKVSAADYVKYLKGSSAYMERDNLLVSVANEEQRDWVTKNCMPIVDEARAHLKMAIPVEFVVARSEAAGGSTR